MTPLSWRVLIDPPLSGPENMARDEALALGLEEGQAVLRLYAWSVPTISFGRNEPVRTAYLQAVSRGVLDRPVVRRPTGGRSVLHDAEVTYAVVVPQRALGGPRAAYVAINQALAAGLRSLGADATVVDESRGAPALAPDAGPCFQSPVVGELVAEGRKLVGSAQARIGGSLLQHGSIILAGDQAGLAVLDPTAARVEQPATLEEVVGPVDFEAVAGGVVRSMKEAFGSRWEESELTDQERSRTEALRRDRYESEDWTLRR